MKIINRLLCFLCLSFACFCFVACEATNNELANLIETNLTRLSTTVNTLDAVDYNGLNDMFYNTNYANNYTSNATTTDNSVLEGLTNNTNTNTEFVNNNYNYYNTANINKFLSEMQIAEQTLVNLTSLINQKRSIIMLYCADLRSGSINLSTNAKLAIEEHLNLIRNVLSYFGGIGNAFTDNTTALGELILQQNTTELININLIATTELINTRIAKLNAVNDSLDQIIVIFNSYGTNDYSNTYNTNGVALNNTANNDLFLNNNTANYTNLNNNTTAINENLQNDTILDDNIQNNTTIDNNIQNENILKNNNFNATNNLETPTTYSYYYRFYYPYNPFELNRFGFDGCNNCHNYNNNINNGYNNLNNQPNSEENGLINNIGKELNNNIGNNFGLNNNINGGLNNNNNINNGFENNAEIINYNNNGLNNLNNNNINNGINNNYNNLNNNLINGTNDNYDNLNNNNLNNNIIANNTNNIDGNTFSTEGSAVNELTPESAFNEVPETSTSVNPINSKNLISSVNKAIKSKNLNISPIVYKHDTYKIPYTN